ncbi:hypothetical protein ACPWT1_13050 [Ramlibacter sp. MMS24-I3-19]|uniref:hypothetical protein n=1 Tax=Ramlibacter sp. MMS24-I3-19 TaxID=3416606 RepID=UPI003D0600DF
MSINAHGEFTVDYDGERFGVPSPIEQSHRHERVLRRLLERLEIDSRTGGGLQCHHVVMFHPKAIIDRPASKEFDTRNVIKSDQFPSWREQFVERAAGGAKILVAIANLRSFDTIKEWGEKLMRQHRPAPLLDLPEFMQPKRTPEIKPIATSAPSAGSDIEAGKKKLICLHCNAKISYPEGKFCWNNERRFKGGQYCREHQALHS